MLHDGCTQFRQGKEIPRLRPRSSICKELVRQYKKWIFISEDIEETKYFFCSNRLLQAEKMRQYNSRSWFIIHPFSKFQKYWQIIISIVWLFIIIYDIFAMAFNRTLAMTSYMGKYSAQAKFRQCVTFFNCICVVHIILCFFMGYVEKETIKIIMEPKKIIRRYLNTWFFVDIFTFYSLSLNIMFYVGDLVDRDPLYDLIELVRIIRLLRLITMYEYVLRFCTSIKISYTTFLLITYLVILFLYIHFSACLFYFIVTNSIRTSLVPTDNWISKLENYYKREKNELYVWKIYMHACWECLLKFQRGGDQHVITPNAMMENIVHSILSVLGYGLQVILLAGCFRLFTLKDAAEIEYDKYTTFLENLMKHKKLPKKLKDDMRLYKDLERRTVFTRLKDMTPEMTIELAYHLWKNHITDAELFQKLHVKVLYELTTCLHWDIFLPGQVVYKYGDKVDRVYGISFGTVAFYTEDGVEFTHMRDNDYFGWDVTMERTTRSNTAVAIESCEVWFIKTHRLYHLCVISSDLDACFQQLAKHYESKMNRLVNATRKKRILLVHSKEVSLNQL